jgi:hypothetical protein
MHIREYKLDQSFRGSIDTMDEIEDFKTYVAEYFSWKVPRQSSGLKRGFVQEGVIPSGNFVDKVPRGAIEGP